MGFGCGFLFLLVISVAFAEVYFEEKFDDDSWEIKWVYSEHPGKEFGKFVRSPGKYYLDEKDTGIQTSQDARFYALSNKFTPFSNKDKSLVIQFTVKHEQDIDCGGGYVKVFDCSLNQKDMHGETPYLLMFGPDICGQATKKVHVIFNYKDKNHLIKKDIRCPDDVFTHLYTLIVKSDNTYSVLIDNEEVAKGELEEDWDFLPPKMITDPNAKKPDDWDDRPTIDDETDKKPEDWDQPEHIVDPDATKPSDWDDEMDGEWEPPMIDNPDYKGEWKPKKIDNPKYSGGPWIAPKIENSDYQSDPNLYKRDDICAIGFDLWQVKSGTIFDNVLITDDLDVAHKFGTDVWAPKISAEKKMKAEKEKEAAKEAGEEKTDDEYDEDEAEAEDDSPVVEQEEHDEL